ncbi:sulfatase family protein [Rhodohalobacter sp. 614A]|uniref:sulfatase family protein n=1 Tax=Rhodohalobacter sp. 614A TaxID=2908649 RepID=UPI001F4261A2|nr:sulfatase [Rhodohalobacter sp. 614A]
MKRFSTLLLLASLSLIFNSFASAQQTPKNVIFILSDDHRYDYMGFHPNSPDFLETPAMDRMAEEGAHLANAFVSTSLCSPSRASILTGQYTFRHRVVDNTNTLPEGTSLVSTAMKDAGYQTAFFGKWHIGGESDDPKPGFDRWVSFRGQGVYYNPTLNVDGERDQYEGYVTDILTDLTLDWLDEIDRDQPFFAYLSHKAVHAEFEPAERHEGMYADSYIPMPQSMKNIERNYEGKPDWVREQRYSWHGVDYMYHNRDDHPQSLEDLIVRYSESLMGVDESIARVLDYLEENGLAEETLVLYMGDNGFMLGEHGLIDKRQAYEESMRVPLLAWAPGFIEPGTVIEENIMNIDMTPTFLDIADGSMPEDHVVDGQSFLPILAGNTPDDWRSTFVYQYFWEDAFPQTPTVYAIRGDRYKYIYYHGLWDKNEFYDLETDPQEMYNLIDAPEHQERIQEMKSEMFRTFSENDASDVRFRPPGLFRANEKKIHVKQ